MTVTIKLEATLEERLRQHAASTGRSTSDVMRAALQLYLSQPEPAAQLSPFALGEDLFGRRSGPRDLATVRKQQVAAAWTQRHARRGS
jgi:plasmid stability protein